MRLFTAISVLTILATSTAHAATFYARSGASAGPYGFDPITNQTLTDIDNDLINSTLAPNEGDLSGAVVSNASGSGSLGSATGDASASADTVTGEMKASASTTSSGSANGGAFGDAQIRETFTLNGTGTFTASMAVDVDWDILGNGWQFQAQINTGFASDSLFFNQSTGPSSLSLDDEILSVSGSVTNAQNVSISVTWYLLSQILQGTTGFIDATNTGTIFFETTDDLIATPSAPSFLTNAVYPDDIADDEGPSPIPLPAGLPLMLLSLGGLLSIKRLKRAGSGAKGPLPASA